jgi:transposase
MAEKSEVIRRLRAGQSIREISRETGIHRATIRNLREAASSRNWLDPQESLPDESEILETLRQVGSHEGADAAHPLDMYLSDIESWLKEKTSFLLIHEFLRQQGITLSETSVRRYIHRKFPQYYRSPTIPRDTIAAEVLEVDFGYFGLVYDEDQKRNRKAWFLSARLRHSRHAYRQMTFDQQQQPFYSALINALEFFGGVPAKVVPDNMKSAVIEASFTDPEINRAFVKMAVHYGFLISPTLPRKPEHKGGVESDVKYIKGNFWPRYRESERQKGHPVPHAQGLQEALEEWGDQVASRRSVRGLGDSPANIFEQQEKSALQDLPLRRWSIVDIAKAKVQQTWRIQFDNAFYSVPYQHIGQTVTIHADANMVVIYLNDNEIARHTRAVNEWEVKRCDHHAPIGSDAIYSQNRESLLRWAAQIGEPVHRMSQAIFDRQGIDGVQSARSLCHLAQRYGRDRLNQACRRALDFKATRYREVKQILLAEQDKPAVSSSVSSVQSGNFRFQREPGYWSGSDQAAAEEPNCG